MVRLLRRPGRLAASKELIYEKYNPSENGLKSWSCVALHHENQYISHLVPDHPPKVKLCVAGWVLSDYKLLVLEVAL